MNHIFVNKYLLFREQDTRKAVLLLFFALLPLTAIFPHAHLSAALFTLAFFALGFFRYGERFKPDKLYALFLMLTLSGIVLRAAFWETLLSFFLRLSFFLPLFFEEYRENARRVLAFVGGIIGILTALSLFFGGGTTGYNDPTLFSELSRAIGIFGNPNVTAAFLLPPSLFALYGLLFSEKERLFFLLCTLGSTLGIAATYSRGALLALIFASVLLFARRFGFFRLLITLVAFFPLLLLLAPEGITARLSSVLSPDSSVLYRFSLWKSVFRLPARTLIFGVGEGKKAMLSALSPVLASGLLQIEHTHSLFLHILLAEGFLGLILFFALCVRAFCKKNTHGARAALLSLLLFGVFDDPLYSGQTEVLFWLTLGLC